MLDCRFYIFYDKLISCSVIRQRLGYLSIICCSIGDATICSEPWYQGSFDVCLAIWSLDEEVNLICPHCMKIIG